MRTRTHAKSLALGATCALLFTLVVIIASAEMLGPGTAAASQNKSSAQNTSAPACQSLACYLRQSYLGLLKESPDAHFAPTEVGAERENIERSRKACEAALQSEKSAPTAAGAASSASASGGNALGAHCGLVDVRPLEGRTSFLAGQLLPAIYDNIETRLSILANWPADHQALRASLNSGSYASRRWGDVQDIGFRTIAPHQQDDIQLGRDIVRRLRDARLLPGLLDDDKVDYYVRSVAVRVAAHSDLRIPLHVAVLDSDEANAFSFPGGYLFIERGLLQAADDEAELAGVIGHEIAHSAARQAKELLRGQSAEAIAEEISRRAATSFADRPGPQTSAAFQHGPFGLGAVMDLKLLGVTPENELRADRLGIQYAWSAGYDPSGFLRFFDKMAQAGYGPGLSWLRTHPPSYQRIVGAERETQYLPEKLNAVKQTASFGDMQNELVQRAGKAAQAAPSN